MSILYYSNISESYQEFISNFDKISSVLMCYADFKSIVSGVILRSSLETYDSLIKKAFKNNLFMKAGKEYSSNTIIELILGEIIPFIDDHDNVLSKIYFEDTPLIVVDFEKMAIDISKICESPFILTKFSTYINIMTVIEIGSMYKQLDITPKIVISEGDKNTLDALVLDFLSICKMDTFTNTFFVIPSSLSKLSLSI